MGTRHAADMSHTWKFSQLSGSRTDSGSDLRGRDGIATSDVAVNCGNMFPRFRGEAQPYRPHDFQSAAICSSVASAPALANIALDANDLLRLSIGQAITAHVLPLHFEQDFCRILLALLGPVPNALNEFFEIFRCHGSNIANSSAPATAVSDVSTPQKNLFPSAPHFAARFSANDASPSDASLVCRRAECIRTSRV